VFVGEITILTKNPSKNERPATPKKPNVFVWGEGGPGGVHAQKREGGVWVITCCQEKKKSWARPVLVPGGRGDEVSGGWWRKGGGGKKKKRKTD